MNCQEILRLADTGRFVQLGETHRRDAETHARSCPHCAPVWATHALLAQQRIPPMPADLATRVRTLAALPAPATGAPAWRRLTVIGCAVALTAAAGMLVVQLHDTRSAPTGQTTAGAASDPHPVPALTMPDGMVSISSAPVNSLEPMAEAEKATAPTPLPLLPLPLRSNDATRDAQVDLALRKAADKHPELVEGPDIDGSYAVAIAIREDGTLVSSAVAYAAPGDMRDFSGMTRRSLPRDGGTVIHTSRPQHALLTDGRELRAEIRLQTATLFDGYDFTRSSVRVLEILGHAYDEQMMPGNSRDMKMLTVLLSEDGHVLHDHVNQFFTPEGNRRLLMGGDRNDATFLAQTIADRLDIDVSRIGLMGVTTLEQGAAPLLRDAVGNQRADESFPRLPVYYAWVRRASEQGPTLYQSGAAPDRMIIDKSAALRIVEREIPDVFTTRSSEGAMVVLSAKGELIRAGYLDPGKKTSGIMDDIVAEQFDLPGFRGSLFSTIRLQNNLGEQADVQFSWEVTEDAKAAIRKAESERAEAQAARTGAQ